MPHAMAGRPRVYVASPIFSAEQLEKIGAVADILEANGYDTYLPHRDGIILQPDAAPEYRMQVFNTNKHAVRRADLVVAILDVKDTGTIWELGCANGSDVSVVALTVDTPKMNVMLECGVLAHARSLLELTQVVQRLYPYLMYGAEWTTALTQNYLYTLRSLKKEFSYTGETQ